MPATAGGFPGSHIRRSVDAMRSRFQRFALRLVIGAVFAVLAEEWWRHDHLQRLFAAPRPVDLAEWGMSDFYGSVTVEEGLGPVFNATSCRTCHNLPENGGTGSQVVLRVAMPGSEPDVAPLFALASIDAACQPRPTGRERFARRIPTPLFGAALVDAIPDATIEALADPDDRDRDGISGRAAKVLDRASGQRRVGRFGWKAQDASLRASVARAFAREMGVTNALFPTEEAAGIDRATLAACDRVPDPEDRPDAATGSTTVDRLTAFVREMPPIAPRPRGPLERGGARVFTEAGCAACHRPTIETRAPNAPGAIHPYSDFLLHDVGTVDGIAQGDAGPDEIRTAPLWGLGTRRLLMHDGSALTLPDAVGQHRGEAEGSRRRFDALPQADRNALFAFLQTL